MFLSAGLPRTFIISTIENLNENKDKHIIPEELFDE